ncbi:MAG: glycosyltransferase family 2 protein [Saonia sp.]
MKKIAAIYTCHNRKEKTLKSLDSLYKAHEFSVDQLSLDVYITDDGSTDGTSMAIRESFPKVILLKGNGNLFWAEGMRNSWKYALQKDYDGYLLLNDDVELYGNVLAQILKTHEYSLNNFNKPGIYIGATEDKKNHRLTYSGSLIKNKFLYTQKRLAPNGKFQLCDLANANIMFVPNEVVQKIGILAEGYSHGIADYDYTLTANRSQIPIIVSPEYGGHCEYDHKDIYADFSKLSFKERKKTLYSPTGLAYKSYLKYMKKFFPYRYPILVLAGWLKLYFPNVYVTVFSKSRR